MGFRYFVTIPMAHFKSPQHIVYSCDYVSPQEVEGNTVYGWVVYEKELSVEVCQKHNLIPEKGGIIR